MSGEAVTKEQDVKEKPGQVGECVHDHVKKYKDGGFKICVVEIPCTSEWVFRRFMTSLVGLAGGEAHNYMLTKHHVKIMVHIGTAFPIDHNRNSAIVDVRKRYEPDYIMQLDNDQTFPQETIIRLFETLEAPDPDGNKREIVSGMYYAKNPFYQPICGIYDKSQDEDPTLDHAFLHKHGLACAGECGEARHSGGDLHQVASYLKPQYWPGPPWVMRLADCRPFRVDVIGVGCVLSRASMWDKLTYPYFDYAPNPRGGAEVNEERAISEDMKWCAQMHRAGIKVWIDPSVQCGHLGVMEADAMLYQGAYESCMDKMRSLPEDDPARKNFMSKLLDLR